MRPGALLVVLLLGLGRPPSPCAGETADPGRPQPGAALEERWGVEIKGIRVAAAGYMLDFRYRVSDARRAAPIFARRNKPVLIDEATGARFVVPRPPTTGPLRNSYTPQLGRTYFMLFGNPGRFVKPGQKVTVEIGEFQVQHLVVQ